MIPWFSKECMNMDENGMTCIPIGDKIKRGKAGIQLKRSFRHPPLFLCVMIIFFMLRRGTAALFFYLLICQYPFLSEPILVMLPFSRSFLMIRLIFLGLKFIICASLFAVIEGSF